MANAFGVAADRRDGSESASIPLYICGFIVTWCGISAVNSVLSNDPFGAQALTLATMGFIFSYVCRSLRIDARIINALPLLLFAYIGIRLLRHSLDILSFIPIEAQQNDNLVAVVLVWFSVVRSWMLITDGAVVFSAVTSIAMIGLVGAFNVNTDQVLWFTLFVMSSLYMIMHQNHLVQRGWLARSSGAGRNGLIRAHLALCVLIGLISLVAATLLVVPIRMIGSNLSLGQAIRQFFAPNATVDPVKAPTVDFTDDPTFTIGDGDGFSSDDTIVMSVHPSDKQEHYWRGRTYDHYGRHGWSSTLNESRGLGIGGETSRPDRERFNLQPYPEIEGTAIKAPGNASETLTTTFDIMLGRTGTIYMPPKTYAVEFRRGDEKSLFQAPDGYVGFEAYQHKLHYACLSDDRTVPLSKLMAVPFGGYPAKIRSLYLDDRGDETLTFAQKDRLAETARTIVNSLPANRRTIFDVADAARQYIQGRCVYSLKVDPVPQGEDPVSYFLFTSRKGYCDLFASSLTLLCRYAGVPARVATGFAPGTRNGKDGYDVRARDKHAWTEVFFPGCGWYLFDATTGANLEPTTAREGFAQGFFHRLYIAALNFLNLNGPIPVVLFVIIVLCLSYVVKIEVVDRLREEARLRSRQAMLESLGQLDTADEGMIDTARGLARARYRRMEAALGRLGLPRRGSRTPAEYLAAARRLVPSLYMGDRTVATDDFLEALEVLTGEIQTASYAPNDLARSLVAESIDRRSQAALRKIERGLRSHRWVALVGTRSLFGRRIQRYRPARL